jgi:sec-independent protein translocase protein TatA
MLGGLGFPELIVILVIAALIFGPGKLPELGEGLGRAVREFQRSLRSASAPGQANLEGGEDAAPQQAAAPAGAVGREVQPPRPADGAGVTAGVSPGAEATVKTT